jgi:GT2 family glycosyltransferase
MPDPPRVSVCVATYNRPAKLARLLASLGRLTPPPGGFEVVVVDDGTPPGTGLEDIRAAVQESFPVPLCWLTQPLNTGRAAARNAAWRAARGELVAFTDDDCQPRPDWLVALTEVPGISASSGASADPISIVQGRTVADPYAAHLLSHPLARSLRVDAWSERFETANVAYKRDLLEQLGGFDTSFAGAGEDTDLGWRALALGARGVFAPNAVVEHEVALRSFRQELADRRRWGDLVGVVRKHPGTRRLAWHGWLLRRSHVVPLAAAAAMPTLLSRSGRRILPALAAMAVGRQLVRTRSVSLTVASAERFAADAYEVAVLARASAKCRTVLL